MPGEHIRTVAGTRACEHLSKTRAWPPSPGRRHERGAQDPTPDLVGDLMIGRAASASFQIIKSHGRSESPKRSVTSRSPARLSLRRRKQAPPPPLGSRLLRTRPDREERRIKRSRCARRKRERFYPRSVLSLIAHRTSWAGGRSTEQRCSKDRAVSGLGWATRAGGASGLGEPHLEALDGPPQEVRPPARWIAG
jgi:hypothetical protein